MKCIKYFCLLLTFGLIYACSSDLSEEMTEGSIAGSVSDRTTGEPVATVNVTLSPGGSSTVTGSDGSFHFRNLEPGSYTLTINKEGYKQNSAEVYVKAGDPTSAHLLIERKPAVVTADREILDFGDNESTNTLSFNIVNPGYTDLEWEIEERCEWIIEVKPEKGILKYGKTEAIVVVINRDLLPAGKNEAVLVVRSSNGSSDVKVTAIGSERSVPSLNTLEVTDITSASAILNGEILNAGLPTYTERGFVYSLNSMPTFDNMLAKLTAVVDEEAKYSYALKGLSLGEKYYVRAYAINEIGTAYSSNELSFTTVASSPELTVQPVTEINVATSSVTFNGNVINAGDPAYFERGFVYSTSSNPTVNNSKVKANGTGVGTFSVDVSGLKLNQRYYVRAYAISKVNDSEVVVYSKDEVPFSMGTTAPEITIQAVSNINVTNGSATLNGTIVNSGNPAYIERGFVYSTTSNPTINNNKIKANGTSVGTFSANVSGLILNQRYYVRAYAISKVNDSEVVVYCKDEVSFSMGTTAPEITIQAVSNINVTNGSATLNGTIVNSGNPAYIERGFVYSTTNNPTINNNRIKANGTGVGTFSADVSGLILNQRYYVRAYTISKINDSESVTYSANMEFSVATTAPEVTVQAVSNMNVTTRTATLNGIVVNIGTPAYIERGFVYGTSSNPTIESTKIKANGTGMGAFSVNLTNLQLSHRYYVRSYAISKIGENEQITYSPEQVDFILSPTDPVVTVEAVTNKNVGAATATFNGNVTNIGTPPYTERGFVYGVTHNPTISNIKLVATGTGDGAYSVNVSNLEINKTYYVRAYAIGTSGVVYSSTDVDFILAPKSSQVSIQNATNISIANGSATLNATITDSGDPTYTERGFVYGLYSNPTLSDESITVQGSGLGAFRTNVTGLLLDQVYYVRAYATNLAGTSYSSEISISTKAVLPEVASLEVTGEDISKGIATFRATIVKVGEPAYTERGFVYSTMPDPTIYDNKIVANGAGVASSFSAYATDLPKTTYYVRAYATNRGGTVYSAQQMVSLPWVEIPEAGIAVQKKAVGYGTWGTVNAMCESSTLGGFTDWRLPTKEELMVIYNNKEKIGCSNDLNWSSSVYSEGNYFVVDFKNGSLKYCSSRYGDGSYAGGKYYYIYGQAVRTISK